MGIIKLLVITILFTLPVWSAFENIQTFQADFKQTITDEHNSSIVYEGNIRAKQPHFALWYYQTPIEKSVFMYAKQLTIVEPELEQVMVKEITNEFNLLTILQSAKQVNATTYTTTFSDHTFTINLKDKKIVNISFKDTFDNTIIIQFSNVHYNEPLENQMFSPKIPDYFDIIH
jgi:outer membrane lipoprotein carrier protein